LFSVPLSVAQDLHPGAPALSHGMMPCGVRTFLSLDKPKSDHPPHFQTYTDFQLCHAIPGGCFAEAFVGIQLAEILAEMTAVKAVSNES